MQEIKAAFASIIFEKTMMEFEAPLSPVMLRAPASDNWPKRFE